MVRPGAFVRGGAAAAGVPAAAGGADAVGPPAGDGHVRGGGRGVLQSEVQKALTLTDVVAGGWRFAAAGVHADRWWPLAGQRQYFFGRRRRSKTKRHALAARE